MIDVHGFPTRILVVDDNTRVRDGLCSYIRLSSDSYLVDSVASGAEALELLGRHEYDVVLCDLRLEADMDGVAVTESIRRNHRQTRVVVFSGEVAGSSKKRVLEAGAFAYLAKPINRSELLHAISTINSIRHTERMHGWFETLTRISWDLQKDFDFDRTAERIVDGVRELGYSRARLYIYDPQHETLGGKVARGMGDDLDFGQYSIPFEASPLIQQIFQKDRPLFWDRQAIHDRFGEDCAEPWMSDLDLHDTTWIDCPLLVPSRRVGTLSVDNRAFEVATGTRYRFTEEERQILGLLSGLAAQALDNARLYEKEALANASLRSIMREAPDAVITTDLSGIITFVSPSSDRVLGYLAGEMLGRHASEFYMGSEELRGVAPPGDDSDEANIGRRVARDIMDTLRSGATISNRRVQFRGRNDTPRPISLSVSLLRDERNRNEEIGTLGILKDLGPLDAQSRQYRDLLEGFGYGTLLLDRSARIVFVNRKAQKLLRRPRGQLLGSPMVEFVAGSQRVELARLLEEVGDEKPEHSLDLTLVQPDGHRLPVKAILTPGLDRQAGAVAVGLYDKSELGALIQSGRLMALGQMVAGVAHEINNPLNHVLLAASELAHEAGTARAEGSAPTEDESDEDLLDYVDMIRRNGLRIRDIVRQLRELARPSDFERRTIEVEDVVRASVGFFSSRLRNNNVELDLELGESLPLVLADAQRLQQVLVNLVVNAEQAMEGQEEHKRIMVRTHADMAENEVHIDIADSGPGVPDSVRDSIFDPFFTTKAPNQGTGLGLSISKSILDLHDGSIGILEQDGPGACFRITLPAHTRSADTLPADTLPADTLPADTLPADTGEEAS